MNGSVQCEGRLMKTPDYLSGNDGSVPIPPLQIFALCEWKDISDFVKKNHYSRTVAKGGCVSHCLSARVNGVLVGAAVFAHTAGNAETGSIFVPPYNTKEFCRELHRFVMTDEMPPNSETRFLGYCLRWLRKNTDILGLLSYADPEHGHSGIIYRASNWLYTGVSHPSRRLVVDGEEMHRKRATNRFVTCSTPMIRQMGHDVEFRSAEAKHRYIYLLDRAMMPFVKYPIIRWGEQL